MSSPPARAEPAAGVGILQLETAGEHKVPVAVWYPSSAATTEWAAGPYTIHATRKAPVAPGKHALILLSHGSGGSEFGHADLAEALARRGYIVAAPRHLGDSYDAPEGRGSDVQLVGRPLQAVATLDAVLADARLAAFIDAARIGMAGFSAGGYTTLVMAGAKPDVSLLIAYCVAHGDDHEICSEGAATRQRITHPAWRLPDDHRVRAAVAMAPFSVMFDAKGLAGVSIPLRIYKAADDQVLRGRWNADALIANLPWPPESATLPGGHYVFLDVCSDRLNAAVPSICVDAPGIDRRAEHLRMNEDIGAFFDRTL